MATATSLFNYELPPDRIAQTPIEPRDRSKLLMLDRNTGAISHHSFFEIIKELKPADLLVMNDTKVFRARLRGTAHKKAIEVFLLRPEGALWQTLVKPGKLLHEGDNILINDLEGVVREKRNDGIVMIDFKKTPDEIIAFANEHGEVPTPPYVAPSAKAAETYQTVYARATGSVAAPTAGFHFTEKLMTDLRAKGIAFAFVTLHVGLGTFRPMQSDTIEEHTMHAEYVEVTKETASIINQAKKEHRRVIAVGTTTVRTLEGIAQNGQLPTDGFSGDINLFITPGFHFQIIDAMITNFHLPKSTLLVLVSAFAGREQMLHAYDEAIKNNYRFYSFGDAMFIR